MLIEITFKFEENIFLFDFILNYALEKIGTCIYYVLTKFEKIMEEYLYFGIILNIFFF